MPLTMLSVGKVAVINGCRAKDTTRKYLEGLGIVPGVPIIIISEMGGNLIVSVKGSRLALSKGVAGQLTVQV
ncbi:MAG: ferrous iron transport protein A [Clostridia bacterium]|nr:ferrous iron transport protein A [Clostridia bacterium]